MIKNKGARRRARKVAAKAAAMGLTVEQMRKRADGMVLDGILRRLRFGSISRGDRR